MKSFVSIVLLCLVLSGQIFAEESVSSSVKKETEKNRIDLGNILVSARGYSSEIQDIPGGTGIITSKDLEYIQPVSISNALQVIPGVTKTSDSAWGSEVNIRGASRSMVVFLVDGIRLNTATDIGAQFGTVDPASVERVEILKGPISSLYGSGSTGGVVNVITKNGRFSEHEYTSGGINLMYNENSSGFNTYAYTSYNSEKYYIFVSGSYRDHDSYEDGNGNEMINSGFSDRQAVINAGFKPDLRNRFELKTQYYEGDDIGIPGAGSVGFPAAATVTYKEVNRLLLDFNYTYTPDSEIYKESKLSLSYHSIERFVRVNDIPAPMGNFLNRIEPEAAHHTYAATFTNRFNLEDHDIVAGIDAWRRDYSGERVRTKNNGETSVDTPIPDSWYLSTGVFAEDNWKLNEKFTLNLGGRFDRVEVKNEEADLYKTAFATAPPPMPANTTLWESRNVTEYSWNAHGGITYYIDDNWSTTLLAARGYRAASLEERYKYINLGSGVEKWGNPDLKPEESMFFEYGVNWKKGMFEAGASVYYNNLDNLIAENQVSSTRIELQNIDEAELYGSEFEASMQYKDWLAVSGNIAYTRGENTRTGESLPSIPPFNGFLRVRVSPFESLWVQLDTVYNASQKKVPIGENVSRNWTRFDLTAGYKFSTQSIDHEIYGAVDNLLDRAYSDYLTTSRGYIFNEPGRTFRIGYRMEF